MANNYFRNLGSALFGKKPTDMPAPQTDYPTDPAGEDDRSKALLALLGSGAPQMSDPVSPGSITPNFGRIGDGGGAASGLGPIVQGGASPLASLEGPASAGMSEMMAMWKKRQAAKAAEPKAYKPGLNEYDL